MKQQGTPALRAASDFFETNRTVLAFSLKIVGNISDPKTPTFRGKIFGRKPHPPGSENVRIPEMARGPGLKLMTYKDTLENQFIDGCKDSYLQESRHSDCTKIKEYLCVLEIVDTYNSQAYLRTVGIIEHMKVITKLRVGSTCSSLEKGMHKNIPRDAYV